MTTNLKNAFGLPDEVWSTIVPTFEKYEGSRFRCDCLFDGEREDGVFFHPVEWKLIFVIDDQAYACAPYLFVAGFFGLNNIYNLEEVEVDENDVMVKPTDLYKFVHDDFGEIIDEVLFS